MDSRERVLTALAHREPDRVPLYFGGTSSFLTDEAYYQLRDYLGLKGEVETYREGHTGNIFDQRILEALDVDVRMVHLKKPSGFKPKKIDQDTILTDWGIPIKKINGYGVRVNPPLARVTSAQEIDGHPWPDPYALGRTAGLSEEARKLREKGDKAVVARSPQSASFLEYGVWLMGAQRFLIALIKEKDLVGYLLDKIMSLQIQFYDVLLGSVGPFVDIVETAEDYGTQTGLMISPGLFREVIKPRRMKINAFIKQKCPHVKILHHSCGAIEPIIDDLIDCGVDILNPVQPLPAMEPALIKKKYGDRISFCGGVNMQNTDLSDPAAVRQEVKLRMKELAPGGGYLFCTSNHIQSDLPPESVVALFRYAKEYGGYS